MSSTFFLLCKLGSLQPQSKFNLLLGEITQHKGGRWQRKLYFTRTLWSLDVIEKGCAESSLSLLLTSTPDPSALQGFIFTTLLSPKTHLLPQRDGLALPLNAKCFGLSLRP